MRIRYFLPAITGFVIGFALLIWWLSPRLVASSSEVGRISTSGEISLIFSSPVETENISDKVTISPEIPGELLVEGKAVQFVPINKLEYGQTFTITVNSGLRGTNGVPSWKSHQSVFKVAEPSLVFLKDAAGAVNLWLANDGQQASQLTNETNGIWDYNVVPDGSGFVVSSVDVDDSDDLVFIGRDGTRQILLECMDVRCRDGRWQPGGTTIAYERQPLKGALNAAEVWLLDVETKETWPAHDPALLSNAGFSSITSRFPRWSPDGRYLAYFKTDANIIIIKDVIEDGITTIPANLELMGEWSPDGTQLAYTETIFSQADQNHSDDDSEDTKAGTGLLINHLVIADIKSGEVIDISEGQPFDYGLPSWNPEGHQLVVGRSIEGAGQQIWMVDLKNGQHWQATDNSLQHHAAVAWSPDGTQVALMRIDLSESDAEPSVWYLKPLSRETHLVEEGGFLPGWLP
jgi:Tol biopolymer transport system component